MAEDLDRQVAEALGYVIVSANKAYGGTFAEGVKYMFAHRNGALSLEPITTSIGSDQYGAAKPWRPSSDAGDAIAALEATGKSYAIVRRPEEKHGAQNYALGEYSCQIGPFDQAMCSDISEWDDDKCLAICRAIILSSEAAT